MYMIYIYMIHILCIYDTYIMYIWYTYHIYIWYPHIYDIYIYIIFIISMHAHPMQNISIPFNHQVTTCLEPIPVSKSDIPIARVNQPWLERTDFCGIVFFPLLCVHHFCYYIAHESCVKNTFMLRCRERDRERERERARAVAKKTASSSWNYKQHAPMHWLATQHKLNTFWHLRCGCFFFCTRLAVLAGGTTSCRVGYEPCFWGWKNQSGRRNKHPWWSGEW